MNDRDLIKKCCDQIEKVVQWGPSDQWTNQDFERLSELIVEKTKVKLSISTLKRVWGKVHYASLPSASTLNAFANYIGHENWRAFCRLHNGVKPTSEATSSASEQATLGKAWWQRPPLRKAVFMTTLMLIGLIIYLLFS